MLSISISIDICPKRTRGTVYIVETDLLLHNFTARNPV